jgi:hypothetical protein
MAMETLASLRWKEDMSVINSFGEHVWLKSLFNAIGTKVGVTDCCLFSTPCQRHLWVMQLQALSAKRLE